MKLLNKKNNAKENPRANEIIKKLIVLALLPSDPVKHITEGLQYIRVLADSYFPQNNAWQDYLNRYFQKQWIDITTPKRFSVFKAAERTNNRVESYHRTANYLIPAKPTVNVLMSK